MDKAFGSTDAHVFIVDDDHDYRESLAKLLDFAGWDAQGFESTERFLEAAPNLPCGTLLLDLRMPGVGGLELLSEQSDQLEKFTVIIVTGHGDVDVAVRSLKLGATDFLEKPFDPKLLLSMLEATRGQAQGLSGSRSEHRTAKKSIDSLSPREIEVLKGMVSGSSNKVIARQLDISNRTVEMHRARLLAKLGAKTSAHAVRMATVAGIQPQA